MNTDEKKLYAIVAGRIQSLRKAQNLSQGQLARLIKVEKTTITNIELCRSRPSIYMLYVLANALKTTVGELIPAVTELATYEIKSHGVQMVSVGHKTILAIKQSRLRLRSNEHD
jgi:transcriptional regulator with XRE-family HTH domain